MTSAISSSSAIKPSYLPTPTASTAKTSGKGGDGDGDHGQEGKVSAPPSSANSPSSHSALGSIINIQV